jgi:alpha-mannosidase
LDDASGGAAGEFSAGFVRRPGGAFGETVVLENELLRVEIGADGTLHRVYDRALEREVLDGRGNQLWAYVDKPREWDAWDVDEDYELEGEEVGASRASR